MIRPLLLVPPLIFAALAVTFYVGMFRANPDDLPSTFIGKPAPGLPAVPLEGVRLLVPEDLRGGAVTVVNFWASWCPPCRAEHPVLMAMAADGIRVAGVNFKDTQAQAGAYLAENGSPFLAQGFDPAGRAAIDWGVSAPPESFIVGGDGTILFRFVGPLVGSDYEQRFLPALEQALAGSRTGTKADTEAGGSGG